MTIDEFLVEFEKRAKEEEWELDRCGIYLGIRIKRLCEEGFKWCPIEFLAGKKNSSILETAATIGMDEDRAIDIINAADNDLPKNSIRQKLLVATGLSDV